MADETLATLATLTPADEAIKWAQGHFPATKKKLISDNPWSKVYKLAYGSELAVLKLVPRDLTVAPTVAPLLAERFPANVPGVIASDQDRGLMLMRNYTGVELADDSSSEQLQNLLRTYASIQLSAREQQDIMACLPRPDVAGLLDQVLQFIRPRGSDDESDESNITLRGTVGADFYLDQQTLRRYYQPLELRRGLLDGLLQSVAELPLTINHCDLRPHNAVEAADGACIVYDWDNAVAAAAGTSLHTLFGGCSVVAMLLAGEDLGNRNRARRKSQLLSAYVSALVAGGYADQATLERCLPGTVLAGALQYLLYYAKYPRDSERYKEAVGSKLQKRLSDLLDLCDFLCFGQREAAARFAADYIDRGRLDRAADLLKGHLWHDPNDAAAHALLGQTFRRQGKPRQSVKAYQVALQIEPRNAALHQGLGGALTQTLDYGEAIASLRRAAQHAAGESSIAQQLDRVFELKRALQEARRADVVPTLPISAAEYEHGRLAPESVALGVQLFREYGVLALHDVFDPQLVERCREHFFKEYAAYFADRDHDDALKIGDKRFQVTMDVEGPLNSRGLYGNPFVLPLLKRFLGDDVIFGSITSSTSLPGADEQWLHKDHRALFSNEPDLPPTPPFAVSMMVPLMNLDERVGTTKVIKGSHLLDLDEAEEMESQAPFVNVGSTYLMDYRLCHYGMPNLSDQVRPIFNVMYQRAWFRDDLNFLDQAPLRISDAEYRKVPEDLLSLLSWTQQPPSRISAKPARKQQKQSTPKRATA